MIITAALLALVPVQVELRGQEATPAGVAVLADASGIALAAAPDGRPTLVVTWDRVRSVRGPMEQEAGQFASIADRSWRARTRLERGDAAAAEPLFEELFRAFRGKGGPTAALVAEGLLRCRLRRGAHVLAIEPWLALLDATPAPGPSVLHADWSAEAGLAPILDGATGLIPAIPPIWAGSSAAQIMAGVQGPWATGDTATRSGRLAALYAAAARHETGQASEVPSMDTSDPGVRLVHEIVTARVGGATARTAARQALEERIRKSTSMASDSTPPWMEAWCRAAVGRSLLRESVQHERYLGIVELLHLPARLSGVHPYLAGLALAEASVALRDMGDATGADTLLNELVERFPDHPVLDWDPIRLRSVLSPARLPPAERR